MSFAERRRHVVQHAVGAEVPHRRMTREAEFVVEIDSSVVHHSEQCLVDVVHARTVLCGEGFVGQLGTEEWIRVAHHMRATLVGDELQIATEDAFISFDE